MAPDAPQIATILNGIDRARLAQRGQYFADVAAFLFVPELSSASPWLNLMVDQTKWGLTDEAYEMLPAQLLSLVRADSVGMSTRSGEAIELRFTACEGCAYRVESSVDFSLWVPVNEPHYGTNGAFTVAWPTTNSPQFFRAVLLTP